MEQIAHYYFNLELMRQSLPLMLEGLGVTVSISALVIAFGIAAAYGLTIARAVGGRVLAATVVAFIDVFRALPALVVIVVLYFSLPYVDLPISPFWTTVLALSCIMAAYGGEALWTGVAAVPSGQFDAARSLGLRRWPLMRHVVLPQATRLALPMMTNRAIAVTKGTALGSVIAVPELMSQGLSIQSITGSPSLLTLATVLYLGIFAPMVALSRVIERRLEVKA